MGTTTNHNLRYPEDANAVAVPADVKKLADDVDAKLVSSAGGTVSGNISFTGTTIVQTPTANNHATNKLYVDTADAAINAELGTNPSGTFSTVVSRLDSHEANIGNLLTAAQATPTAGAYTQNSCTEGAAGVFTASGGGEFAAVLAIPGTAFSVGDTLTLQANLAMVGRTGFVILEYLTAGASIIRDDYGNFIPAGGSGVSTVTGVVPATTASIKLYLYTGSGAGGDTMTATRIGFWKGASGQWAMPGTPIVGQSHISTNGAVHLSGTGTPQWVVTAAPGSTWLQTDSTLDVKGWIRWVKATGTGNTGWVAGPEADTGWRDVSAGLLNSWVVAAADPAFQIRRVGMTVTLRMHVRNGTVDSQVYATPSGFRPSGATVYFPVTNYYTGAGVSGAAWATTGSLERYSSNAVAYAIVSCPTNDAWPTSLPGSAI